MFYFLRLLALLTHVKYDYISVWKKFHDLIWSKLEILSLHKLGCKIWSQRNGKGTCMKKGAPTVQTNSIHVVEVSVLLSFKFDYYYLKLLSRVFCWAAGGLAARVPPPGNCQSPGVECFSSVACSVSTKSARWYHVSDTEHFCNSCFEYFYR